MNPKFRQVVLFGKHHPIVSGAALESSRRVLDDIAHFISRLGCEVVIEHDTAQHLGLSLYPTLKMPEIGSQCDLGLVIGGDGTMLGVGRQVARYGLPLIGINQGRLGFITDIPLERYAQALQAMLQGQFEEEKRSMLHAQVWRDKHCVFDALAMNDVVVNRGATSGMVELRIEVDGRFVSTQRADGLIIATPTGSTAYSLSAGGPLIAPSAAVFVITPICPHSLSQRSLVLSDQSVVKIAPEVSETGPMVFAVDGRDTTRIGPGDWIEVKKAERVLRLLLLEDHSFYQALRQKLRWQGL